MEQKTFPDVSENHVIWRGPNVIKAALSSRHVSPHMGMRKHSHAYLSGVHVPMCFPFISLNAPRRLTLRTLTATRLCPGFIFILDSVPFHFFNVFSIFKKRKLKYREERPLVQNVEIDKYLDHGNLLPEDLQSGTTSIYACMCVSIACMYICIGTCILQGCSCSYNHTGCPLCGS